MSKQEPEPEPDPVAGAEAESDYSSHTTPPEEYDFSLEEVQQIVDAIDEWVFIKNYDGEYILSNEKQSQEAYGITPAEMRGQTDIGMLDIEVEEEKVRADDIEVMEEDKTIEIPQERITGDDGTEYILQTVKKPFYTDVTDQEAMIGVATDISDQVRGEKLVSIHESTQELINAQSSDEIARIAVETITEVMGQDYCTVWEADRNADRLKLIGWSDEVAAHSDVPELSTVTASGQDMQWRRFVEKQSSVETKVKADIDPTDLPVDEPLNSLIVLPIGDYGLLEVGSFDDVLFKDYLAKILASSMETAFGRLERERELRELAKEVEGTATDVAESTGEVSRMSQNINDQAAEQFDTMTSISSDVDAMSATIQEIAATADQVETTSTRAAELADDGQASASNVQNVIDDLTASTERVVDDMEALQERVEEIDTIVDVINDIADQTNILALNASIEANRADESGEAFAIVADEVKALAGESQDYAADIESLIANVQDDTDETVESLQAMLELVEKADDSLDETMAKLSDITDAVEETSSGITEVANATDDQASNTESVASRVEDATESADEIADSIERIADANQRITEKVSELEGTVARLSDDR